MKLSGTLVMFVTAMLLHTPPACAQTSMDELRAALKHRFDTVTPALGELLPDVELYDENGRTVQLREVAKSERYTVLTLGCLTCPPFRRNIPGMETLERDFTPKGIAFYYIYKALAHMGNKGYVTPFTLEERLLHVKEAKRTLGTEIPWLVDSMDNTVLTEFGGLSNVELVVDAEGFVVHRRMWSDPVGLRQDLEKLVGKVAKPTSVEDLGLQQLAPSPTVAKGIVAPINLSTRMWPLLIEPVIKPDQMPFFVKLRADGDPDLINTGQGKLYLGFFLDPLHKVHWNNEAPPMKFEITAPSGIKVLPARGAAPKIEEPADADPREFLVDVVAERIDQPLILDVNYYACDDALTFCAPVSQRYRIRLERDKSHSWLIRGSDS